MDFTWVTTPATADTSAGYHIKMSGEIRNGDFDRFKAFIRKSLSRYESHRFIEVSSNGGNLVEALKIAELLKIMYPSITVDGDCASACFYIYLSGSHRFVKPSSRLGVHRAYFDKTYFAGLTPRDAKKRHTELAILSEAILEENGVPQEIKEIMARTPSFEIYWLSKQEISKIGNMPDWYEEFMIAKCNYGDFLAQRKLVQEAFRREDWEAAQKVDAAGPYVRYQKCEDQIVRMELSKLPTILKK